MLNKPQVVGKIWRWLLLFQEFDFDILLHSNKKHVLVDHLSRIESHEVATNIDDKLLDEILFKVDATARCYTDIIQLLSIGTYPPDLTPLAKRRLLMKSKPFYIIQSELFCSSSDGFITRCVHLEEVTCLLEDAHNSPIGGHFPGHITAH